MNFSSDNIELFLAVLDRGSFSAAARALRRVPSAVSMAIANMEAELGFALFDRSHREPTPTALALVLAPHARLIAGQLKQLQVHAIELSQGLESRLSIGVASDINGAGLLAAVKTLSQRYPLLNIEVLSAPQDDVLHMLHEGRIGVCLAFGGLNVNSAEQFHFVGSLRQRVELQHQHNQTVMVADLQGLTDNGNNPQKISANVLNVVADYLAVGIDPHKTTICLQSVLPALAELTMYYLNLVSVARLERNPTVKNEIAEKDFARSLPAGFLIYSVSQAADITAFGATHVPVGEDQLPMLEQTNEIVRRFNHIVGQPILTECQPLLSNVGRLPGLDGQGKMSKSRGNAIPLGAGADEVHKAVMSMFTDPGHLNVSDPGRVEGNMVFTYLDAFCEDAVLVAELKAHYRRGGLGGVKIKRLLEDCLQSLLEPIRTRRAEFIADKGELTRILQHGTRRAHQVSQQTLQQVKAALGLDFFSLE